VRVDSGVAEGREASGVYDPLIAKLVVVGVGREQARRRMLRALGEFVVEGPATLIPFHQALLAHECFIRGETCSGVVDSLDIVDGSKPLVAHGRTVERTRTVEVDGKRFE